MINYFKNNNSIILIHRGTYYESIKDICLANRCHITHVQSPIPHQKTEMSFFLFFKQRDLGIVKENEILL